MKLNPEDLVVSSFDTSASVYEPILLPTTDPTAETRCYYCPPATMDGCW